MQIYLYGYMNVSVLAEHGLTITLRMYEILFARYPDLRNIFNMSHIHNNALNGKPVQVMLSIK